jgi:hypothetical protein
MYLLVHGKSRLLLTQRCRVLKVFKEQTEQTEPQVHKGLQVHKAQLATQGLQVQLVQMAMMALQDQRVLKAQLATQVLLAHKDHKGRRGLQVLQDRKDQQVLLALLDRKDQQVLQVLRVLALRVPLFTTLLPLPRLVTLKLTVHH